MAKKKKEPKVEKVFDSKKETETTEEVKQSDEIKSDVDDILGKETPEDHLTERQKNKLEKLNNVKHKISKILQSQNIEIVDENFDDDYDYSSADNVDGQSQQDYDSLKAMFGRKDKNKKQEVTLTIDDFDYMYVGQYLEEYDLMHMKNIKKVRIQKKRSPKLKKFLIISAMVVVAAIGGVLGFFLTRKVPVYLKAVTLNQSERQYNVDDSFDDTGLYFIAEYSDGSTKRVKLNLSYFNSDLSTGRFDRRTDENTDEIVFVNNGTANLVFSYEGFNVDYKVVIEKSVEKGISAVFAKGIYEIAPNGYITNKVLFLFMEYDQGKRKIEFSNSVQVYVGSERCPYNEANKGFRVASGTTETSEIKIRVGNFETTLDINTISV